MLFALRYQLSESHDDDSITDQELFSTIMNQIGEDASQGELEEGSTVHMIQENFSVYTMANDENQFLGACLDAGGSVSPIGRQKAEEYYKEIGIPLLVEVTPTTNLKLSSATTQSIRKIGLRQGRVIDVPCR